MRLAAAPIFAGLALVISSCSMHRGPIGEQREPPVGQGASRPDLPRFDRTVLLESTSDASANVAIGDLDKDGRPDIAAARSGAPNVVYFAGLPPSSAQR